MERHEASSGTPSDDCRPILEHLGPLIERLVDVAREDEDVRLRLRGIAEAVLDLTEDTGRAASDIDTAEPATARAKRAADVEQPEPRERKPLPPLTLGQPGHSPLLSEAEKRPRPVSPPAPPERDLSLIETRCRLKAEGARWAAKRRRLIAEGADFTVQVQPIDRDIILRAKALPDCFLWMNHPDGPSPSDMHLYEVVAGCFDVLADAVALVRQVRDEPELFESEFEHSLDLLAESQSAVRAAIVEIDGPSTDSDQKQVFEWLKQTASECGIYIARHMRLADPADPYAWEERAARIEEVDSTMEETRRQAKQRRKLLGKVRHKAALIAQESDDADENWSSLVSTVDELVENGLPPSNRELRELLVPVLDDMPEISDLPQGFELVLREVDRAMAASPPPEKLPDTPPTDDVREVANLLRDHAVVLIGGDRRLGAEEALKEAFGLRALYWISTREHQSVSGFERYVARDDVAVVLLAIRWSSHSFGEVKGFCDKHGKPLVRLPGGYNPNQVAAQIMAQCSDRLAEA